MLISFLLAVGVKVPSVLAVAPPASALKLVIGILPIAVFTTPDVTNLFASSPSPVIVVATFGVNVTAPAVVDTPNTFGLPLVIELSPPDALMVTTPSLLSKVTLLPAFKVIFLRSPVPTGVTSLVAVPF